jgi:hypothetical protein
MVSRILFVCLYCIQFIRENLHYGFLLGDVIS